MAKQTYKRKVTNKSSRLSRLINSINPRNSKKRFIIFVLIFGAIGGFILYRTFAATTLLGYDGEFHAVTPARILDTRSANGVTTKTPIGAGKSVSVQVTGRGGIPAASVKSVVMNVSAVTPTATSTLIVWPTGISRPNVASVNFTAGQGITNQITVPVGADGKVQVYNSGGSTHVVFDVSGYIVDASGASGTRLQAITPTRILDTRSALGITTKTSVPAGGSIKVQVAGNGSIPGDATSAVLNLTAVAPTANGTLIAWPSGYTRPAVASLNFTANRGITNQITVPIGADGKVSIYNSSGNTHVVVEAAGYYTRSMTALAKTQEGRTVAVNPYRFYDSRTTNYPLSAKTTRTINFTGYSREVGGYKISAVLVNVTAVSPTVTGTLTVYPAETTKPNTASVNFTAKQGITNQMVVPISQNGGISVTNNSSGTTHLVVDVAGYVLEDSAVSLTSGHNYQDVELKQESPNTGTNTQLSYLFKPTALDVAYGDTIELSGVRLGNTTTGGGSGWVDGRMHPTIRFAGNINGTAGYSIIELNSYAWEQADLNYINSITPLSSAVKPIALTSPSSKKFELTYEFVTGRAYKFTYQIYENSPQYGTGKWLVYRVQDMSNGVVTDIVKANLALHSANITGIYAGFSHRSSQYSINCSKPRQFNYIMSDFYVNKPFTYGDTSISDPFTISTEATRQLCPGVWSAAFKANSTGKPELNVRMGIPVAQRDITPPTVSAIKVDNRIRITASDASGIAQAYASVPGESMLALDGSCFGCYSSGTINQTNVVREFTGNNNTLDQYQSAPNITEYIVKVMDTSYNVTEVRIPK